MLSDSLGIRATSIISLQKLRVGIEACSSPYPSRQAGGTIDNNSRTIILMTAFAGLPTTLRSESIEVLSDSQIP